MLKSRLASDVRWAVGKSPETKTFFDDSTTKNKTKKYKNVYYLVFIIYGDCITQRYGLSGTPLAMSQY